jgi:hypothetical protein
MVCGFAHVAFAEEFEAPLTACLSNGTAIGGVNSCGKIWKLKSGKAELKAGGKLEVEVKGLVLNDTSVGQYNGTPDGVDAVAAAVIYGLMVARSTPEAAMHAAAPGAICNVRSLLLATVSERGAN